MVNANFDAHHRDYGSIIAKNNVSSQNISNSGFTIIWQFTENGLSSKHIVPDYTLGKLEVNHPRIYRIEFDAAIRVNTGMDTTVFRIFVNGNPVEPPAITTLGEDSVSIATVPIEILPQQEIDVRATTSAASATLTVDNGALKVESM